MGRAGLKSGACAQKSPCALVMRGVAAFIFMMPLIATAAVDVLVSTFTDTPDPAVRGGVVTYSIVASNNGDEAATNVTISIPLPATVVYESGTLAGGTCPAAGSVTSGNNIVCSLSSNLPGGNSANLSLLLRTSASTGSTVDVQATVATSSSETNSGNNTSTQNTTINNGADLRLTAGAGSPDPVAGGGNITWTLSGDNQGPNSAPDSAVSVTLPASLTFVSGSGAGFSCSANGQNVTCNGPALANGASFSGLNLVTKVTGAASGNAQIAPRISSSVGDPDPNNNALASSVVINPGADLRITQNSPSPSPARSNENTTFSLQATNLGPSDATNGVTVTYQLPADFTYVSAVPNGAGWGACTVDAGNLVSCVSTGNFASARTDNITIIAKAPTVTSVQAYNGITATIAHNAGNPTDPILSNNSASVNLNVSPDGAGLSINKTRSPNPVAEGQNITSVIRVANQGPTAAAANTIIVTDTINTADETFVSFSGSNWSCTPTSGGATLDPAASVVTCTYSGTVASGASANQLNIITQSRIKGSAYTATNNAGVSCASGQTCWFPVPTMGASVSVTQATNSVDLAISKTVSTAGGTNSRLEFNESTMTYLLTVRNLSATVDAQDIVVRDPIPGYRSDTPTPVVTVTPAYTNGSSATFNCAVDASGVMECTQSAGILRNGDTVSFSIPVSRNLNAGSFTNTATVNSTTQGDTNTANNTASVAINIDPIADVQMVSKIPTPASTEAGTNVTYILTFRNNGPSPAAAVTVTDTFTVAASDPGFTVVSITPQGWTSGSPNCSGLTVGQSYGPGTATLTCAGGNLNSGEQRTITMVVRPNWKSGQAADTWTIPNTATIATTTAENVTGTDGGNNSQSATVTLQAADVDLLVNNKDNVDPLGYDTTDGGNNAQNDVIYTVNLVNNGPSLATGVRFTYAITPPSGKTIRFLGDSAAFGPPSGSICNNIGSEVTGPATLTISCVYTGSESQLANAASRNRYLSVRLLSSPATGGDIHNTVATVFANETDRNPSNNQETESTTVRSDIAVNNLSLGGRVFTDINNDGLQNVSEPGIPGVSLTIAGTTSAGVDICTVLTSCTVVTDSSGNYVFSGLPPANAAGYTVTETQPAGFTDGKDQVGSLGNVSPAHASGTVLPAGTDTFTVPLTSSATGYNFGEPPAASGSANLSGHVWLDSDHDRAMSSGASIDVPQQGWIVELLRNGSLVDSRTTDQTGAYVFAGLTPGSGYQVRFIHPTTGVIYGNAVPNESGASYTNGSVNPAANPAGASMTDGTLSGLTLQNGDNILGQSLPLDPAGVVYNSVTRAPVPGAQVTINGPAGFNATHLVGGNTTVTTGADGRYQFLLTSTAPNGIYSLTITAPAGFQPGLSTLIPVCTATLGVNNSPDPALMQTTNAAPAAGATLHNPASCPANSGAISTADQATTLYYASFNITNTLGPNRSANVVNNHLPLDPILAGALIVSKTTPLVNVAKGDLVPYTVTVTNALATVITGIDIVDRIPAGFKYRSGSASLNGSSLEPISTGRDLTWKNQSFAIGERKIYKLMLVVGTGVGEGEYVNQAWAQNAAVGTLVSNVANATVRVTPDPTFDCSDIIGKVFDDKNANGYQDEGEPGIANVRVVTVRGLLVTTDAEGRFHVACADIPESDHGSNFVMKLDERTLPSGYRVTTENPRDVRVTRGKMAKLNFGATIHRVIRVDLSNAAFAASSTDLLAEWQQSLAPLAERLSQRPSILRLAYDPGDGDRKLAKRRLDAVANAMRELWKQHAKANKEEPAYPLVIETALEGQP